MAGCRLRGPASELGLSPRQVHDQVLEVHGHIRKFPNSRTLRRPLTSVVQYIFGIKGMQEDRSGSLINILRYQLSRIDRLANLIIGGVMFALLILPVVGRGDV